MTGGLDLRGTITINTSSASGAVRALDSRLIRLSQSGNTSSKTLKEVAAAQLTAQRAAEANARAVATLTRAQAAYNKAQAESLAIRRKSVATAGLTNARAAAVAGGAVNAAAQSEAKVLLTTNRALTEEERRQLVLEQQKNVQSMVRSRTLRDQLAAERAVSAAAERSAAATSAGALTSRVGINGLRSALGEVGSSLTHVGLVSGVVFAGMIANAISMQAQFAKVVRTSDIAEISGKNMVDTLRLQADATTKLRLQFDALAQELPISYKELTEIGAAANQLGVSQANLASFTKTVAQFAATTGVSVDTASTAFGRLDSLIVDVSRGGKMIGGVDHDYQNLADSINKVGVNSVATDQQIINVASQISGIANSAGLGYKEIIGFSGALASVNVSPYLARGLTTRLFSNITDAVSQGGTELAKFAQVSGLSAQQFAAAWKKDPSTVLTDLFDGIRASGGDAVKVLKGLGINSVLDQPAIIRLANAADSLGNSADAASRKGGILRQTMHDAATAAGENAKQYAIIANTVQARLQVALNRAQIAFRNVAESDLGPLSAAIGTVSDAVLRFSQGLDKPVKLLGAFQLPITNGQLAGFASGMLGIVAVTTLLAAGGVKLVRTFLSVSEAFAGLRKMMTGSAFAGYIAGAESATAANQRLAISAEAAMLANTKSAQAFTRLNTGRFNNMGADSTIASKSAANNIRAVAGLTPQIQRMYSGLDNVNTATQRLNASTSAFAISGGRAFTAYMGGVDKLLASNNRVANSLGVLGTKGTTAIAKLRNAGQSLVGTAASMGRGILNFVGGPIGALLIAVPLASAAINGLIASYRSIGTNAGDAAVNIGKASTQLQEITSIKVSSASPFQAMFGDKDTRSFVKNAKELHAGLALLGSGGTIPDMLANFKSIPNALAGSNVTFENITSGLDKLDAGFKTLSDSGHVDTAIQGIQQLFKGASKQEVDNALGHMGATSQILNQKLNELGLTAGKNGGNLYKLTQGTLTLSSAQQTAADETKTFNAALQVNASGFQDYIDATKTAASAAGDLNTAWKNTGKNASFSNFIKQAHKDMDDFVNSQRNALKIASDTGASLSELSSLDPGILAGAVKGGKKAEKQLADVMLLKDAIANFQTGAGQLGNSPALLSAFEKLGKGAQDKIVKALEGGANIQDAFTAAGQAGVNAFNAAVKGAAVEMPVIPTEKLNDMKAVLKLSADPSLAYKQGEDAKVWLSKLETAMSLDANTLPAVNSGETAKHYLSRLASTMHLDANTLPAITKGETAQHYLARLKSFMTLNADNLPAIHKGETAKHYIDRLKGTITADANTRAANDAIDHAARDRTSVIHVEMANAIDAENKRGVFTYATGGAVRGNGTATSDSISARLSNGEHVWTAKEVAAAGGQGAMYAMRRATLEGRIQPANRYATGGAVTGGSAKFEGTVVQIQSSDKAARSAMQGVELSAYDRHLLMVIADSVGVQIGPSTIASVVSTNNARQSRRGNG